MKEAVSTKVMLEYLQEMMNDYQENKKEFGNDRFTEKKLKDMIACKEMVEALIGMPVNLRLDGKVTVGF